MVRAQAMVLPLVNSVTLGRLRNLYVSQFSQLQMGITVLTSLSIEQKYVKYLAHNKYLANISFYDIIHRREKDLDLTENGVLSFLFHAPLDFTAVSASLVTLGWSKHSPQTKAESILILPKKT